MAEPEHRIAFIDHSFHQQSKSSDFFLDALGQAADVVRYWDHVWEAGKAVSYASVLPEAPQRAVFWQAYPTLEFLRQFKGPVVVAPMYDDPASRDQLRMMSAFRVTAVCFSKAVENVYRKAGMDVLPLRYAPEPKEQSKSNEPLSLFFWDRGRITWNDVKALIGDQKVGKIYLKQTPDPGYLASSVTDEDRRRFDIELLTEWMDKEKYESIVSRCDLYVAPRLTEGIGLSFLEAMALGVAVVGANRPTMNEYIENGTNGYLFDLPASQAIDFSDARRRGRRALDDVANWRKTYEARLPEVVGQIMELSYRPPGKLAVAEVVARNRALQTRYALGDLKRAMVARVKP